MQAVIDKEFELFEKFTEKIAKTYNYDKKEIVIFLGAGSIIKYSPS